MYDYLFLFGLALVWLVFATIQDFRRTEIADWLTFSLIGFALGYRAIVSLVARDADFFLFGLAGTVLFLVLALGFYYGRAFAGGDAKLLIGLGAVLPFERAADFVVMTGGFLFLLFGLGTIYSVLYTVPLAVRNKQKFARAFNGYWKRYYLVLVVFVLVFLFLLLLGFSFLLLHYLAVFFLILVVLFLLVLYVRAAEHSCFIKQVRPRDLMAGDWLVHDVRVGNRVTPATVHGLFLKEIGLLRKQNVLVTIRAGVPFAFSFLLAFVVFLIGYYAGWSALFVR